MSLLNIGIDLFHKYVQNKFIRFLFVGGLNTLFGYSVGWGFIISLISMIIAVYNVIAYFAGLISVPGFTSTVFSIWFVGGMIMMQLGIVGIYIGKVFDQVKGRPLFVVMDEVNV